MTDETICYLNVPDEEPVRHKNNFIKTAVCELKFPTLLELEESPPVKMQKLLRKNYPHYSKETGVGISEAGPSTLGKKYLFESKKRDWIISLRTSAISLETSKYTEFEEFFERLEELLGISKNLLDTDFFTRIGLRYINIIPIDDTDLNGWLNPILLSTPVCEQLGTLSQFNSEFRGFIERGQYAVKHGFPPRNNPSEPISKYYLDFDHYSEGVEYNDALELVKDFNKTNYSLFMWSLGQKAKEKLVASSHT